MAMAEIVIVRSKQGGDVLTDHLLIKISVGKLFLTFTHTIYILIIKF